MRDCGVRFGNRMATARAPGLADVCTRGEGSRPSCVDAAAWGLPHEGCELYLRRSARGASIRHLKRDAALSIGLHILRPHIPSVTVRA